MPHQCTTCGHAFPDGSKEMLSGCPDCGGNKFQFHPGELPDGATADGTSADGPTSGGSASPSPSTGTGAPERSQVASAVGKAADTLRDFVAERARPPSPSEPVAGGPGSGSSAGTEGADAADARPETTQATLDALAADAAGDQTAAEPAEGGDDGEDVASRWPSVGTEAGVETEAGEESAASREWPDPWAPDDGDDDVIVAPPPTEADGAAGVAGDAGVDADPATTDPDADPATTDPDADPATTDPDTDPATTNPDADPATSGRDAETVEAGASTEDRAQADARTSMVDVDDLPDRPTSGRVVDEPTGERPDLAQLREELNDQFESIKVVAPGQYELNLMELYDREEYIIAIQENGRYVIEVPGDWETEEA